MNQGEITSIVSLAAGALTYFGITFDPTVLNSAVTGVFALIALGSGIWSWYVHNKNNS